MSRIRRMIGDGRLCRGINVVLSSALFGFFHHYQGTAGIISTSIAGLVLSVNFFYKKDKLWQNVMIHGLIDSIAVTMLFLSSLHT